MSKQFLRTAFNIGFGLTAVVFLGLNLIGSRSDEFTQISGVTTHRGFPFRAVSERLSIGYDTRIFWGGLIADFAVALICSFLVGMLLKITAAYITRRRPVRS